MEGPTSHQVWVQKQDILNDRCGSSPLVTSISKLSSWSGLYAWEDNTYIMCPLMGQLHHSYGNDDSEYIPFYHLGVNNDICIHCYRTHDILVHLGLPMQRDTLCVRQGGVLRRTKETSQYRRNTSNYGTCKEHLMCYMIIMHMSPYDTYGSM